MNPSEVTSLLFITNPTAQQEANWLLTFTKADLVDFLESRLPKASAMRVKFSIHVNTEATADPADCGELVPDIASWVEKAYTRHQHTSTDST